MSRDLHCNWSVLFVLLCPGMREGNIKVKIASLDANKSTVFYDQPSCNYNCNLWKVNNGHLHTRTQVVFSQFYNYLHHSRQITVLVTKRSSITWSPHENYNAFIGGIHYYHRLIQSRGKKAAAPSQWNYPSMYPIIKGTRFIMTCRRSLNAIWLITKREDEGGEDAILQIKKKKYSNCNFTEEFPKLIHITLPLRNCKVQLVC